MGVLGVVQRWIGTNQVLTIFRTKFSCSQKVVTSYWQPWWFDHHFFQQVVDICWLLTGMMSSSQPILVWQYACLNGPMHQSGENFVCPMMTKDCVIFLFRKDKTCQEALHSGSCSGQNNCPHASEHWPLPHCVLQGKMKHPYNYVLRSLYGELFNHTSLPM